MRARHSLLLAAAIVCAALFTFSCAQPKPAEPPDTRAADEATIRAADADWAKAADAKDLDKCMSYYLDDAVLLGPGAPAQVGKENIRKFIQGMISAPGMQIAFPSATVTVARSGDLAEDRGTYQVSVTDKKGKATTQTGQYVLVWKKQADGSWKIAADTSANDK